MFVSVLEWTKGLQLSWTQQWLVVSLNGAAYMLHS